ncbi:MAG TPA: phosphatase PAP2 family protein [Gemmatimonadaceae bacterium]|jgi:undecaprenyl-diphosphatase|nr:phosphatase PAP2 family protein [Gemmatimonadaceae bacterium]
MTDLRTIALGAATGTIALAIATCSRAVQSLDDAIERVAGRARAKHFVLRAASIGTLPGEPYMHPAIGAASALALFATRGSPPLRILAPLAAASLGAIVAHHAVKLAYRRLRPAIALGKGKTEPAYPSGHTTDATAVLFTGAYLLVREGVVPVEVAVPVAVLLAVTTGVSRVLLGWHWATDVVGGWLTGIAVAAGCAGLYEMLAAR